jgi:hypothetical protein
MNLNIAKLSGSLLLAVTLLTSCASHVKIENSWRNQNVPAATYNKLLVIAVTQQPELRKLFENILSETLRSHGVEAMQSYPLLDDLKNADKAQVQKLAKEVGADAVLITHGLSRSESTSYRYFGGSLQERVAVSQSADENSSTTIIMSAIGVAPLETDFVKGSLMSRFFDVASTEMAWSALTKVIHEGSKADACWDFSILLTKALAKDTLITVNDKTFRKPTL